MRSRTSGITGKIGVAVNMLTQVVQILSVVHFAQVEPVQPGELGEIEDRPTKAHTIEAEVFDHVLDGELLAAIGQRPAHHRQVVEHRLRHVACALVVVEGDGVLALADLRLVRVAQERHVHELGCVPAEGSIELHVLRCGGDPLLGADHMRDLHHVIVHHVGEVVGGVAVALEQHLVVDLGHVELDVTAQSVLHLNLAGQRHFQANHST